MSPLPSRKLSAMFFCVFALGVAAGVLLDTNLRDLRFSQFLNRTVDPVKLTQRLDGKLAEQYHLDAAEQARIAPLTKEMAQNLFEVRRKFANDVLATLDDSHAKIGAQMTPEQRAAYEKDNVGRKQRAEALLLPTTVPTGAQP